MDSPGSSLAKLTVNLTRYSPKECQRLALLLKKARSVSSEDNQLIKYALHSINLSWEHWLVASFWPGGAFRVAKEIIRQALSSK